MAEIHKVAEEDAPYGSEAAAADACQAAGSNERVH